MASIKAPKRISEKILRGNAYARLLTHLKSEGAALQLPFRESYIKGPGQIIEGNPENFLTEIQIMVA